MSVRFRPPAPNLLEILRITSCYFWSGRIIWTELIKSESYPPSKNSILGNWMRSVIISEVLPIYPFPSMTPWFVSLSAIRFGDRLIGFYRGGISYPRSVDPSKRSKVMYLPPILAHNVFYGNISNLQCVRDERPVTAPWNGLGAHQANSLRP
jgi:hypothetical protein